MRKIVGWAPPTPPPCTADPGLWTEPELYPAEQVAQAKRICNSCDFRLDCLESALAEEGGVTAQYRCGIRGGLGTGQRETLSRKRRKEARAA